MGYFYNTSEQKFEVKKMLSGRLHFIGRFNSEEEAIEAEVMFMQRRERPIPDSSDKEAWKKASANNLSRIANNPNYYQARGRVL